MKKKKLLPAKPKGNTLFAELSQLIEQSQRQVATSVNSMLSLLFWQVGRRINGHILQNKRADYGKEIVVTLSRQLTKKYGRNFEEKNLRRMLQFAEQFPDFEIVVTLSRQLSWSHFITLLPLKKETARLFYAKRTATDGWGVRELRDSISRKEFERTAIAKARQQPQQPPSHHDIFRPLLSGFFRIERRLP